MPLKGPDTLEGWRHPRWPAHLQSLGQLLGHLGLLPLQRGLHAGLLLLQLGSEGVLLGLQRTHIPACAVGRDGSEAQTGVGRVCDNSK